MIYGGQTLSKVFLWFLQMGFDAVRVFKKRSKALKKIHKLIKKGKLQVTEVLSSQQFSVKYLQYCTFHVRLKPLAIHCNLKE